ncbi:MAG: DUF4272 domain-containing protein [Myxococcales bacterium]|nr:DUF4272 domain-containing protein [Myxococcales bacterium]
MAHDASIRETNIDILTRAGFVVASDLLLDDEAPLLRPVVEIAKRFLAIEAVYAWCSVPQDELASDDLKVFVAANHLETWMSAGELKLWTTKRSVALEKNAATIGWRLENMWPLAWVLGFEPAPGFDGAMIDQATGQAMVVEFAGAMSVTLAELVARATPRSAAQVIAMEDLFYCAHNAARQAQSGAATVPSGFDAVVSSGVIMERRHALTWCLSPGIDWDDTNLDA